MQRTADGYLFTETCAAILLSLYRLVKDERQPAYSAAFSFGLLSFEHLAIIAEASEAVSRKEVQDRLGLEASTLSLRLKELTSAMKMSPLIVPNPRLTLTPVGEKIAHAAKAALLQISSFIAQAEAEAEASQISHERQGDFLEIQLTRVIRRYSVFLAFIGGKILRANKAKRTRFEKDLNVMKLEKWRDDVSLSKAAFVRLRQESYTAPLPAEVLNLIDAVDLCLQP